MKRTNFFRTNVSCEIDGVATAINLAVEITFL